MVPTGAPVTCSPDVAAAMTALQADPGVPARGVDRGVRLRWQRHQHHPGRRGARIPADRPDRAPHRLLRRPDRPGAADPRHRPTWPRPVGGPTGTSAIGSLSRLRAQCRGAKERLSQHAVTALPAELPGFRGDIRLTRTELDEAIRRPLAELARRRCRTRMRPQRNAPRDLVAVASVGGGAGIPRSPRRCRSTSACR